MGQKTGDVIEHYIDPNNYTSLKNNYRKALPYLAINDEITMVEDQEAIDKLERENQSLQEQMKKQQQLMLEQQKQHQIEIENMAARVKSVEEVKEKVDNLEDSWLSVFNGDGKTPIDEKEIEKELKEGMELTKAVQKIIHKK
jgi:hypothetical protein